MSINIKNKKTKGRQSRKQVANLFYRKTCGMVARSPGKLEVGFAELGSNHEEAISSVARPENSKVDG